MSWDQGWLVCSIEHDLRLLAGFASEYAEVRRQVRGLVRAEAQRFHPSPVFKRSSHEAFLVLYDLNRLVAGTLRADVVAIPLGVAVQELVNLTAVRAHALPRCQKLGGERVGDRAHGTVCKVQLGLLLR